MSGWDWADQGGKLLVIVSHQEGMYFRRGWAILLVVSLVASTLMVSNEGLGQTVPVKFASDSTHVFPQALRPLGSASSLGKPIRPSPVGVGTVASTLDLLNNTLLAGNVLPINGQDPVSVTFDPTNGLLYVTESGSSSLSVVDTTSGAVKSEIPVSQGAAGVALDMANGYLYVSNPAGNHTSVIDPSTERVIANIRVGTNPVGLTVDPTNDYIYVANAGSNNVSVINGTTNKVVDTLGVGNGPDAVTVDMTHNKVYVANSNCPNIMSCGTGTVSVINGTSDTVTGSVVVGLNPDGLTVDQANGRVYVTNMGELSGGNWLSSNVSIFDDANDSPVGSIPVGKLPRDLALDGATGSLFVTEGDSNNVVVINTTTDSVDTSLPMGPYGTQPMGIVMDAANGNLYATDEGANNLRIIYGANQTLGVRIPLHSQPKDVAIDSVRDRVYVSDGSDGSGVGGGGADLLTVINGSTNLMNESYGLSIVPYGLVVDSITGHVFATNNLCSSNCVPGNVTVLDETTGSVLGSVPVGYEPVAVALNPATGFAYVANSGGSNVSIFNFTSASVVGSASVGTEPAWIAVDPVHEHVYVTNKFSNSLSVIDGVTNSVIGSVPVGIDPIGVAVDSANGLTYVADNNCNSLPCGPGNVTVLNSSTDVVVGSIRTGTAPVAVVMDSANGDIYVTNSGSNNVTVINGTTNAVMGSIQVGSDPTAGAMNLANGYLYITNEGSGTVSVIAPGGATTPSLVSVSVSPPSASLSVNGSQQFAATPTCSGGPCPSGTFYAWTLNNSLGSVNPTTGVSTTFTAGPMAGTAALTVTATLNGVSKQTVAPVTITPTSALASVTVTPLSPSVTVNGTQGFTATPACTSMCPGSVAYIWTVNNSLGSATPTTGSSATFTAGPAPGSVLLTVRATLNGTTKWANATITITATVGVLSSVSISPTSITVGVGSSTSFIAHPNCTGGTCPSGATYSWILNNTALGAISPTTGPTETFTAGNTPGSVLLYATASLNGVQQTGLAIINITKGTVPTITGLTLTHSPSVTVQIGKTVDFSTTATCNVSQCPTGIGYNWGLNNTLGTLSSTSSSSATFTAGPTAGLVFLTVTATLNGGTQQATSTITISNSPVPTLSSVSISPGPLTLAAGKVQDFTGAPACSPGPCPASVVYTWKVNNTLGSLNTTAGSEVALTAGTSAGALNLTVSASYNGNTVNSSVVVTVTATHSPSPGNSTTSPTFLGLPGYDGYILLAVLVGLVAMVIVIALTRRKKAETPPSHSPASQF